MKHKIIQPEDDLHNLSQANVCDTFKEIMLLFHFDLIFVKRSSVKIKGIWILLKYRRLNTCFLKPIKFADAKFLEEEKWSNCWKMIIVRNSWIAK